jgi:pimeloyl-ACP methyl ester carboxylesterase
MSAAAAEAITRAAASSVTSNGQPATAGSIKEIGMADVKWTGGREHWIKKGDINLFMWEKPAKASAKPAGTILFVHGSSMASQPTFDLQVPGRPYSSAMDWFAEQGYNTWCMDNEGYGRSDKDRPINFDISNGADDLAAGSEYILKQSGAGKLLVYGISSGALKAALFAQRHPERVARLALDAFVWTGEGSPTLHERKKKLADFLANNRRPIDRAFVQSIFNRDHADCADAATVAAFADAILTLDDSMPTGTYVDMCSKLPLVDPQKITVPSLVLRGQYDGIASIEDLLAFFNRLPNMDKQFSVMAGISHASFQQKNYMMVYHILNAFFTLPKPVYQG